MSRSLFTLLILLALAAPFVVLGQVYDGFAGNIILALTPEFPRPNEKVTVALSGFSVDVTRAEISWSLNGVLLKKGVGAREVSFVAGALGSNTALVVTVESPFQGNYRETLSVRPAEVDILWKTDGYLPPFYKGKALPTPQAPITLVAMPALVAASGKLLAPETLVYEWRQDGRALSDKSGFGKQSIAIEGPRGFQDTIVSVAVSSFDKSIKAEKTIVLDAFQPKIVFYEKHPLRGVLYERAIGDRFALEKEEVVLRAEPYFFPEGAVASGVLDFSWVVNDQRVFSEKQTELALRKEGEAGGTSSVRLEIKDLRHLVQAVVALLIQF